MTTQKPFLPKNIFHAHELFLRAFHLDQQRKWEEAQKMYFQSGKIFTALIKKFPDMSLFYLWSEEARLAIHRIKQLTANQSHKYLVQFYIYLIFLGSLTISQTAVT